MNQGMLKPALIGGAAMGVASQIPFVNLLNCACCALIIGGGVLSAYLYTKDDPSGTAQVSDGLLLGALAGVIGAVAGTVISIPITLISTGPDIFQVIEQSLEGQQDVPPFVRDILAQGQTGGLALGVIFLGLFFSLIINTIFGAIGGAIGVAIFNKNKSTT